MTRRGLTVLVVALLSSAATARLGWWQLDRAGQKNALQSALDQRRAMPRLDMVMLATDGAAAATQHHRAIRLEGQWLADATVYLDNRQMNGRPGFFAVTPLLLADGTAVLVQRGWLPRDMAERARVAAPPLPTGLVHIEGRIAPPPGRLYEFDGAASGAIRQNLNLDAFARELSKNLRPLSVVQEEGKPLLADGLLRQWPQPAADVHKHYGYAFQWFALSALIVILYVWFQLIRPLVRAHQAAHGS